MRELRHDARPKIAWLRVAAAALVVLALGALAPALWAAVRAGAGLLALVGLLLLGWGLLQALPYVAERLERRLLRARVDAAREHPLEELFAQLVHRSEQLERYRRALATIAAQIEGLRELLEQRRVEAPQEDVSKQGAALQKMLTFHEHHVRKLGQAEQALADYKRHVTHKRFEWMFARAGQQVLDSLRASDRESIVRELLSDEAGRSVQESFDRSFALLDLELRSVERLQSQPGWTQDPELQP